MTLEARSGFYAAEDGLRLHYLDFQPAGLTDRTPVVCLPGLTRGAGDFAMLGQALAFNSKAPRRVVAFDYRGRGLSDHASNWIHYDLATERRDFLTGMALLGIEAAHFVGTSRGGLHIMTMAAEHRATIRAVVLNDIGPVLEPEGLRRIKGYVGAIAAPKTLDEAIRVLKIGTGLHFDGLDPDAWRVFATTTFGTDESDLRLRYDPALARTLDAFDLDQQLPTLWDAFDALEGAPVLAIRGANSDLLSDETLQTMARRWDGCKTIVVPGQGHAPLLADTPTLSSIEDFLFANDMM